MGYRKLFILVEGLDDARFFDKIIKPIFEKKYNEVMLFQYAQRKKEKVDAFLKSIKAMGDYFYVKDINDAPCVTAKKQKIQDKLNIDKDRIVVVIEEIESWYLAGLDNAGSKKLGMRPLVTTSHIAKEQFDNLRPKKFDSRIDFMLEILKRFSIKTAKDKNRSFRYFLQKHDC